MIKNIIVNVRKMEQKLQDELAVAAQKHSREVKKCNKKL